MKNQIVNRNPAVAGQFYPAYPDILQLDVRHMLASAITKQYTDVRAIICPHAGYVFSGKTAASAFNQIDSESSEKSYERIFLVASSHHEYFDCASVYCDGDYIMPYGEETVDTGFCKMLVENFPDVFTDDSLPHLQEHSLEVQLPFLHYTLKKNYKIVPIIIGTDNKETCRKIASILKQYFTSENLFVISTDFSHYPDYSDAKIVDELTKEAIISNKPELLLSTLVNNSKKHIPHLVTSLCGWTSVLTLLYMTCDDYSVGYHPVEYCNSGDNKQYGDRSRVVGYWGIAVTQKTVGQNVIPEREPDREFQLSDKEKEVLLNIARKTIEEHSLSGRTPSLGNIDLSPALETKCGAFVTLHKKGELRGCIGRMKGDVPLYKIIQEMAVSASSQDYRFNPVVPMELNDIDIEISVLSPLRKISDISQIEMGRHGIYIEKGARAGVFLPQVATETGWSKEEFLGHCARDKAGLGWDGWKYADIYIFTATIFS